MFGTLKHLEYVYRKISVSGTVEELLAPTCDLMSLEPTGQRHELAPCSRLIRSVA
jgi:hypothetical protein